MIEEPPNADNDNEESKVPEALSWASRILSWVVRNIRRNPKKLWEVTHAAALRAARKLRQFEKRRKKEIDPPES
ncbi:hypothetical protein HY090_03040 [Candidatus Kaiserbacteria bacterium]|nr:hypothetical protein [Candidatus Kaiserbacteria bacterium]